jgi:hypothetical protein
MSIFLAAPMKDRKVKDTRLLTGTYSLRNRSLSTLVHVCCQNVVSVLLLFFNYLRTETILEGDELA